MPKRSTTAGASPDLPPPPLRGKQLAALRAVAATPGGLRLQAYPSVMPLLERLGIVEARPIRGASAEVHWFLTSLGRRTVTMHGRDEP